MRITSAPLILWFLAAYRCHIAGCTTSRDSVAASERSSSSNKSDKAQDYDSDGDAHDDYVRLANVCFISCLFIYRPFEWAHLRLMWLFSRLFISTLFRRA